LSGFTKLDLKNFGKITKIKIVETTHSPQDAMKLSAYLNVIDGLAHNTGSFTEKMLEQEGMLRWQIPQRADEINRIRDITRLENPQDVINLIGPYTSEVPKEYRNLLKRHVGLQGDKYRGTRIPESRERLKSDQERRRNQRLTSVIETEKVKPKTPPPPPKKKAASKKS
jgi:hypothetical protein